MRLAVYVLSACFFVPAAGLRGQPVRARQSLPNLGPPLSERALRARLFAVAADSMRGRAAGSRENNIATDYVATEFAKAGVRPAGDHGSYFQSLPLSRRVLDSSVVIVLKGRPLVPYVDYLPRDGGPRVRAFDGAPVIYAGAWEDSTHLPGPEAIAGKTVVLDVKTGQLDVDVVRARFARAAAVCIANLDAMSAGQRRNTSLIEALIHLDTATRWPELPSVFHVGATVASAILGVALGDARPGQEGVVLHGAVQFRTVPTPARNVIAVLPGRDPALRGQYVVIGAHNDHLGVTRFVADADSARAFNLALRQQVIAAEGPATAQLLDRLSQRIRVNMDSIRALHPAARLDSIYNGADDDGSGTVALVEIARAFAAAAVKPRRSILFISHTAEEMGDLGSEWFMDHPTVPRDSIVAMVNLDMIGRGGPADERNGGPDYLALVGTRRRSSELGDLIERVSQQRGFGWRFDYSYDARGHPEQVYCRSDHTSYARYGIPIAFMFTGYHADYHQLTDEAQYVDYAKLAKVSRFAFEVVQALGNLDHRLIVDQPRPDPGRRCRQ